ncbi:MAG TPA: cytochrome c-type biogenesis protein CcmH [Anaerolineales bacterium]|nr:cytochrome c-type biogenesis protein CcmH [Anaerolineales bacterium]HNA89803.1 cytochrome c-type biogenesis protein CcmH [Anaerolineales bacterium]HNB37484.1 cytochrome c-type biogenesis protein CcmH [Anaerolineales bacterium]
MKRLFEIRTLRVTFYVLLFIALAFATFTTAFAQDTTPTDDEVNAIAKQLYCPVCENTPLDVCPTEACRQWRELIRQQLAEGKTEEEIKQYFVANYGARVLSEPPRTGFNWLVYILPPVFILAGAFFLFRSFREWTKPRAVEAGTGAETEAGASVSEDDYIARLEEELKKRK